MSSRPPGEEPPAKMAKVEVDAKPMMVRPQIEEKDVGIVEFLGKHAGFTAVFKQRYADFLVNEIGLDDKVVHLTSVDLPSKDQETVPTPIGKDVSDIVNPTDMEKLAELLNSGDREKSYILEVGEDKDSRIAMHIAVAHGFPGLDTKTIEMDGRKVIETTLTPARGAGPNQFQRTWPRGRADYCRFALYSENKGTMDTLGLMARLMGFKPGRFQYAGTKDKRSKTTQDVTAYRLSAEKLRDLNSRLRNIVTGNYRYVAEPLRLGQLQGNYFTIVLRELEGTPAMIQQAMTNLQTDGFINYFGMQRFGTTAIPTYAVGRELLHSNWKEAVEMILKPRAGENERTAAARTIWWETKNLQQALDAFPKKCYIDRSIVRGLMVTGGNDYKGALGKLARNQRMMYVHSYQSYVWNSIVSRRIREYGMQPIIGDMVFPNGTEKKAETEEPDSDNKSLHKVPPIVVTRENLQSYSIYDVVLPLPGYDVVYPDHVKSWYTELMAKDNLDPDNMRHSVKEYSLSGTYRKILEKPRQVSWKMYKYDDPTVTLALSDWDKFNMEPEAVSMENGQHTALRMELVLPPSAYATMAIREVTRMDLSQQAALFAYYGQLKTEEVKAESMDSD